MNWRPYLFTEQPVWDEGVFKNYEAFFDVEFPAAYKNLVKGHQGEVPETNLFDYREGTRKNTTIMGVLFHFVQDAGKFNSYNIKANYLVYKDRLPAIVIPFSEDPGGFQIAFDFRADGSAPKVVLIDWDASTIDDAVRPVADSFELFMKSLYTA